MNKFRLISVFVVLAMLFGFAGISPAAAAGANVLILADTAGAGTPALVSALTTAGYTVTVFAPEYNWNGSPALAGFQCVIHLDGTTYSTPLSVSAQLALVDYVESGHCFVGTQWDGYERAQGIQTSMNDLILQGWPGSQQFGPTTLTTVTGQAGHPVLAGIGSSVSVNGGYLSPGILYSYAVDPPTVLMVSSTGEPAVIVREFGSGCVVNLAFALNYSGSTGLNDPTIQRLFINSIDWGTSSSCAGNQPPTANAGGPYSGNEGSAIAMGGATASDPDLDTLTYAWTVDPASCSFDDASALNPNLTCSDNGSYTATLSVSDGVNPAVNSDASVTVSNVDPTVGLVSVPAAPIDINNQPVTGVSAPFTDPGTADTHTCTVDYGDGSGPQAGTAVGGVCTGLGHAYTEAGVYVVTVAVTDDDLGVGSGMATGFIVIYDPSAGFVTGGGWIDSPVNEAYQYMQVGGKANFGFVAKYKKGANVPDGNTQFQFRAGDLNFHSSSYEWLVVAGNKAQFKGEGTINGQGSYKFMITADDDSPDTFRIKIWNEENGLEVVVYDNGSQQSLGGGSIKVHK